MKALQFLEVGKPLQLTDIPRPVAQPGGLVFKVKACGICTSDLHAVEVPGLLQAGNVLGHEYAGVVVEVGSGVEGWRLAGTYLWVLETTVGLVWQESILPFPEQLANARASRHSISEVASARFASIVPHLNAFDGDDVFAFAIERTLAGITQQLERSSAVGTSRSREQSATARPSGPRDRRARAKPRKA